MPKAVIHDFRVTDKVLAQTDPDAGDIVYLGRHGNTLFPFVVSRRVSGPSGWYIDACEIIDPVGKVVSNRRKRGKVLATLEQPLLAAWDKKFEIEGESVPIDIVDEVRDVAFAHPGEYRLRYSMYDETVIDVPFQVVAQDPPYGIIVPGPLDASLSKSTICWVAVPQPDGTTVTEPVWYGYEGGRIYVLVGEGEQQVPGLTTSRKATVIARSKDKQSAVAEVECAAAVLGKDAEWDTLARDLLIGRRLNLRDGDKAADRWKKTCEIVALTPLPAPGS